VLLSLATGGGNWMRQLAKITVPRPDGPRVIELLHGDLAAIPPEHRVDVLVVSAFPNDFLPTPTSLIGALDRKGLSVEALSHDKLVDLRQQFSCWLSKPVPRQFPFRHVLCIESGWRGTLPEITDDLFRALAPYLLTEFPNSSVAMPLIGTGDQGWNEDQMLRMILKAGLGWIQRGLPLRLLKIVVRGEEAAKRAHVTFAEVQQQQESPLESLSEVPSAEGYDVFLSYAREESNTAQYMVKRLRTQIGQVKVFFDQESMRQGTSWTMQLATALDVSHRVVALYSPSYWQSKNCQMEFMAALARQNDTNAEILFPIYLREATIPYLFQTLQHVDCRVDDRLKVGEACDRLLSSLREA
jgi:hypothetical protein